MVLLLESWEPCLVLVLCQIACLNHSDHCTYMETQSHTEAGSNTSLNSSPSNWQTWKHLIPLSRCSCYSKCFFQNVGNGLDEALAMVVTQWLYQSASISVERNMVPHLHAWHLNGFVCGCLLTEVPLEQRNRRYSSVSWHRIQLDPQFPLHDRILTGHASILFISH